MSLDDLFTAGFDQSCNDTYTDDDGLDDVYVRVGCSQCAALCVNGMPCHECGCPNAVCAEHAAHLAKLDALAATFDANPKLAALADALAGKPYTVIDLDATRGKDRDRGSYDTLDEARGCVEYDGLDHWQIWGPSGLVDEHR